MSEQLWYLYQNSKRIGPFNGKQVVNLFDTNMIADDAFVFKVGWKDWQPISHAMSELGIQGDNGVGQAKMPLKRAAGPRATISAEVFFHNNTKLGQGRGANISSGGMFVETDESIFEVGDTVKITVKCPGLSKPFNTIARVVRRSGKSEKSRGYGFKFEGLMESVKTDIERLIDQQDLKADVM